jgi:hypothetical protein
LAPRRNRNRREVIMNDKKLTLELTVNDVNLIMAGLGKLPLEAVVDLWMRIKQQGEAQLKATRPQSNPLG